MNEAWSVSDIVLVTQSDLDSQLYPPPQAPSSLGVLSYSISSTQAHAVVHY